MDDFFISATQPDGFSLLRETDYFCNTNNAAWVAQSSGQGVCVQL
jgi:hypothetical protein